MTQWCNDIRYVFKCSWRLSSAGFGGLDQIWSEILKCIGSDKWRNTDVPTTRLLHIRPKDHDGHIVGDVLLSSNSRSLFDSSAVQVNKQATSVWFMTKYSCSSQTALFGVAVLVLGAILTAISVHHLTPSGHRVQTGAKISLARYRDGSVCCLSNRGYK